MGGILFAQPSFVEGLARTLDLGNTLSEYNYSATPEQADYLALLSDVQAVRQAYEQARGPVEEEIEQLEEMKAHAEHEQS